VVALPLSDHLLCPRQDSGLAEENHCSSGAIRRTVWLCGQVAYALRSDNSSDDRFPPAYMPLR